MRRLLACLFIGIYLSALTFGLFSHTVGYQSGMHVGMYFFVWDMYCGWGGHEIRHHLIARGESGQYYELTPSPWGEFVPYGSAERHHYDGAARHTPRIAQHILDHTEHEPITQILLIEEAWSKKYNVPDALYEARHEEPKVKRSYFRPRLEISPEGKIVQRHLDWIGWLSHQSVIDNPRLQQNMMSHTFMTSESIANPGGVRQISHTESH